MADKEKKWLDNAKNFVAGTFPKWETETRVLPPHGIDIGPSLVSFLSALGEKNREPMFIICSRDVRQLMKTRFSGGLYERLEEIQRSDHDVVVIDKLRGLFLIEVCYMNETQESGDSKLQRMQEMCDNAKSYFNQLKVLLKQIGIENNLLKKFFPIHFPMIAFPRIGMTGKTPQNALILYKEECQTQDAFESWWNERIAQNSKVKKSSLGYETYKTFLALYVLNLVLLSAKL